MGRRKRPATDKPKKRKKVTVKLLERSHAGKTTEPYRLMDQFINSKESTRHAHLKDAKIAIAWRFGWSQDADGRIKLGQVKKGSDLDREMHQHDFVILLNHEVWNRGFDAKCKLARMEHELCHCAVTADTNGEPKTDEQGRTVWRIRKHDIEEFPEVVANHGLYSDELEKFAQAAMNDADQPLLGIMEGGNGDNEDSKEGDSGKENAIGKENAVGNAKKKLAAEKKRRTRAKAKA